MLDATMLNARAYVQGGGSKDELARAAGIHRNTLIGIERPEWAPNVGTLRKLADGLAKLERAA